MQEFSLLETLTGVHFQPYVSIFLLKQIVKEPTREDVILDLILTNMSDFCSPVEVIAPVGLSDHKSVLCIYSSKSS